MRLEIPMPTINVWLVCALCRISSRCWLSCAGSTVLRKRKRPWWDLEVRGFRRLAQLRRHCDAGDRGQRDQQWRGVLLAPRRLSRLVEFRRRLSAHASDASISTYFKDAWPDFIQHQLVPFGNTPVYLGIGNHELVLPMTRAQYIAQFADWLKQPTLQQPAAGGRSGQSPADDLLPLGQWRRRLHQHG